MITGIDADPEIPALFPLAAFPGQIPLGSPLLLPARGLNKQRAGIRKDEYARISGLAVINGHPPMAAGMSGKPDFLKGRNNDF